MIDIDKHYCKICSTPLPEYYIKKGEKICKKCKKKESKRKYEQETRKISENFLARIKFAEMIRLINITLRDYPELIKMENNEIKFNNSFDMPVTEALMIKRDYNRAKQGLIRKECRLFDRALDDLTQKKQEKAKEEIRAIFKKVWRK